VHWRDQEPDRQNLTMRMLVRQFIRLTNARPQDAWRYPGNDLVDRVMHMTDIVGLIDAKAALRPAVRGPL
jgi:hypothetical protein